MLFQFKSWKTWLYAAFAGLTIVWMVMYMSNGSQAFIAATVICIGMSAFSIYDFRNVIKFRAEVAQISALNDIFEKEKEKIEQSVETLNTVNGQLRTLSNKFKKNNKKLETTLNQLQTLVGDFKSQHKNMKKEESEIVSKCMDWIRKFRKEASYHVGEALLKAFQAIDKRGLDSQRGLNREEYKLFFETLPSDFQEKILRKYKDFDAIDGALSKDGNIDLREFRTLMTTVCSGND